MSSQIRIASTNSISTQPVWLFAGQGGSPEQIYFSATYDLKTWIPLAKYTAPTLSARDPAPVFHRGRWYCAYTISPFVDGAFGTGTIFGIAVSDDLLTWRLLANIDLAAHLVNGAQEIWGPQIAEDANGDIYMIVMAVSDGRWLFLQPKNQNDLTTTACVSDVTFAGGTSGPTLDQAFFYNGLYYLQGPGPGSIGQALYTATAPQGPYTYQTVISGITDTEGMGLTVDKGDWYSFSDMFRTSSKGIPQWQVSHGNYSSFGPVNYGNVRKFANSPMVNGENNRCVRYYGAAALSIRAAIQQVVDQAPPTPEIPLPVANHSYATANGAIAADNFDATFAYVPTLVSGTTSGAQATVTLLRAPFLNHARSFLANDNFLPLDFRCQINANPGGDSGGEARLLFGVPVDHLGDLDHAGIGLRFFYDASKAGNGRVELVIHDGTTLSIIDSAAWQYGALTNIRVLIDGVIVVVWVDGEETFRSVSVPTSAAASLDSNYNAIVFQQDYGTSGGNHVSLFLRGTLRYYEK